MSHKEGAPVTFSQSRCAIVVTLNARHYPGRAASGRPFFVALPHWRIMPGLGVVKHFIKFALVDDLAAGWTDIVMRTDAALWPLARCRSARGSRCWMFGSRLVHSD